MRKRGGSKGATICHHESWGQTSGDFHWTNEVFLLWIAVLSRITGGIPSRNYWFCSFTQQNFLESQLVLYTVSLECKCDSGLSPALESQEAGVYLIWWQKTQVLGPPKKAPQGTELYERWSISLAEGIHIPLRPARHGSKRRPMWLGGPSWEAGKDAWDSLLWKGSAGECHVWLCSTKLRFISIFCSYFYNINVCDVW